jgi:glyoxylase-like metal-dependent hydrolase (beta-lactamase superfamily II)
MAMTVRLHPLLSATNRMPRAYFHREHGPLATAHALGIGVGRGDSVVVPTVAYLMEHPHHGPVLVDTGLHESVAKGRAARLVKELRLEPPIREQVRERGVDPQDIGLVLMTHLHVDHAGALRDFPGTTVLTSTAEWRAAHEQGLLHGYHRPQFDRPDVSWRLEELEHAGPLLGFDHGIDLFGDGSVVLVYTPGHTRGHFSLVLRLESARPALLAIDAAYTTATLHDGQEPWRVEDRPLFRHSLAQVKDFVRANPDALVIPGHDIDAWSELEPRY